MTDYDTRWNALYREKEKHTKSLQRTRNEQDDVEREIDRAGCFSCRKRGLRKKLHHLKTAARKLARKCSELDADLLYLVNHHTLPTEMVFPEKMFE